MAWVGKRGKTWFVRYRIEDDAGNVTNKRVSGFASKEDAWEAAKALERTSNAGIDVNGDRQSVGYWIERWFSESCVGRVERTTLSKYNTAISILQEHPIYKQPLRKLTKRSVSALAEDLRTRGGKVRSVRTALDTTEPLRFALSWAFSEGLIPSNPIAQSRLPKAERPKQVILNDDDMRALADAAGAVRKSPKKGTPKGGNFYIPVLLALYGGMRRQEVAALRWSDIDFKRNTITITQAHVQTMEGLRIEKDPKSETSRRTISMPAFVMRVLSETPKRSEYVCVSRDGKPFALQSYAQAVTRLIQGINKAREGTKTPPMPLANFHDLRHTHAGYLIRLGMHPKVISERLGHASIKITMDTYGYLMAGLQESVAHAIDQDMRVQVGANVGAQAQQNDHL